MEDTRPNDPRELEGFLLAQQAAFLATLPTLQQAHLGIHPNGCGPEG